MISRMLSYYTVFHFLLLLLLTPFSISVNSAGIRSVVDDEAENSNGLRSDPMCNVCEMAVVWMQNQLSQNKTQDLILDYVNNVRLVNFSPGRSTSAVVLLFCA